MSFQQRLTDITNIRQEVATRQRRQRQTIVRKWNPIVHNLLQILGETMWGENRYTVIDPVQSATWTLLNFKGSKNSQFFIILDFNSIDLDAILASGKALPNELVVATGFRVIGANEYKAGVTETELERILSVAHQTGANQDKLPDEIKKALQHFPYQVDEYDQRGIWKNIIMWMAGPVTIVMSVLGLLAEFFTNADRITSIFLVIISIPFLIGGIWATKTTNFGRQYNKLHPIQKKLATLALFPGMAITVYISLGFLIVVLLLIFGEAGARSQESEVRKAVRDEFNERGL